MTELAAGIVVAERFRLEKELGRGGMGSVWRAHHIALDIPCAVKFIVGSVSAGTTTRVRFQQEARAAAKLRSPNVVQMLDYGIWEGRPYIAMELLEGESLATRLAREETLPPLEVLAIARDVARALARAEELGIVHRDLKPDNIFVVKDGDRELAKVLDFGVAKAPPTDDGPSLKTKTGALVGTPYFVSPEQAHGAKDIDHRSDVWALGVVIYRAIVGRLPFRADGLGALLQAIMTDPLPVPSRFANVPPGFDEWWQKAAARDPEARFQSASELVEAIAPVLTSRPSKASAPTLQQVARGAEIALAHEETIRTDDDARADAPKEVGALSPRRDETAPISSRLVEPDAPESAQSIQGTLEGQARLAERRSSSSGRSLLALTAVLLVGALAAWFVLRDDGASDHPDDGLSSETSDRAASSQASSEPAEGPAADRSMTDADSVGGAPGVDASATPATSATGPTSARPPAPPPAAAPAVPVPAPAPGPASPPPVAPVPKDQGKAGGGLAPGY